MDILKSQHLTTFIPPESTYRPLAIPLPPVQACQKWRLGLFPTGESENRARISNVLCASEDVSVVGVWSEPISVTPGATEKRVELERESKKAKLEPKTSKGKGKEKEKDDAPKQSRIHREWLFDDDEDSEDRILRIIEQTSYDLDKVEPTLRIQGTRHRCGRVLM